MKIETERQIEQSLTDFLNFAFSCVACPNKYLNDSIIEFFFDHLSSDVFQSEAILFVPPSISFWLANAPDLQSFNATIEPLNLHKRQIVFFTVNDNTDFESSDGGSHWSLLVYCKILESFFHYDSLNLMNSEFAYSLCESMRDYVDGWGTSEFVECSAPKQRNGHDCGLYAMEIARVICKMYGYGGSRFYSNQLWFRNIERFVDCDYVESAMRLELICLIMKLKEEHNFHIS